MKPNRRTFYQVTTKKFCAGITVDQYGKICYHDTAPCFMWAAKKGMTFQTFRKFLLKKGDLISVKKIDVEIDPV